ncbi:MAG: flagellar biosynthesis anti-sigma factor FlgM [Gammaproteobacteria bacterium]|nr:flagellar biosynthesis anti-sigma factor FlgM [Gammaproteobacteria bacterium]NNF61191.1 flagellar biosynthesis anti-sigma factor FlgM [Gammaproteobacteria bacterium]NNM19940.1 flagellar biosynthesis anti-sigma factor FlgM [Gammaproteobacteria bacterium]
MNPKINGIPGGSPRIESGQRSGDVRKTSEPAPASPVDQVSLTESARLMVRLEKILEDLPTVDRGRVDQIKQAIADGTYSVNAEKVAAEVLRMEMGLNRS